MTATYCVDEITLDSERITEKKDPDWGDVTVFHDVVIASEIVQPYMDGMAFKSRDELEAYTPTVDGRWVMTGKHPDGGIISDRSQIHGRTVNSRSVKDLIDPKTKRPNRAGVRADVEIFNDKIPKQTLTDMKNGVKKDVSIGFFFTKDETPGVVADGAFKGAEYDYVQRNMFHDHLAAGIDQGRCPSPYCGIGADEMKQRVTGDPFAGFPDFESCVVQIMEEQELDRESAEKICGSLKSENEDTIMDVKALDTLRNKLKMLLNDEFEAIKGEILSKKETDMGDWWRRIDWSTDEFREIYNSLNGDTQTLIVEAGLCPDCQDKEDECPEGQMKNEEGKCVPEEETEEDTDCGCGEKKTDTPIQDSAKSVKKEKLNPHEVLARFDSLKPS